jgi:hypothetical protein
MRVALNRVILYVQDVENLATFYRDAFGLSAIEQIKGEWAVLDAGPCQLALHRVFAFRFRGTPRLVSSRTGAPRRDALALR